MPRLALFLLLFAFGTSLLGCSSSNLIAPNSKPYKETQFLMDTIIEITAYGPNREQAVKEAFGEFERIHRLANVFDANSQVGQINQQAGKASVVTDGDLISIIGRAQTLSNQLNGTFDISIGPLTELWGIGRKGEFVPTQADINDVLSLVDYRLVKVDERQNTVFLPRAGMKLDLGGIAKGYATDKAIERLKAHGIKSALVNAGGNVRVIGARPDGQPWRIGVQHPQKGSEVIAKLALTEWDTMETSGDYQRFITVNGVRYSHILDPRTGWQPREVSSVTMVLNNSTDGDIFSTALFILGIDRGLALIKQFPGVEAIIVTNDGQVVTTPGLAGKVEITAN